MTGGEYGICHRALVREVGANGVIVEIPTLAPGAAWGPIPSVVPDLAEDEQVLVAQISTSRDTLVVVGRIPGRAPTIAEIVNLASTITTLQAVDAALDTRLDTAEADIDALQAADVSLDGRLDTLEAHTHTTVPSLNVTAGLNVGGALDVNGATVLEALAAESILVTNYIGAHNSAVFTELREANAHGVWGTKIRAKDNTVHNRSARQPIVHGTFAAAVNVTVGTALTQLNTFSWTQRETGNVKLLATIIGVAVNGNAGNVAQSRVRWRLVRVNGPLQLAEQDFFYISSHVDPAGTGRITTLTVQGMPDVVLTQGTIYRFELHALEEAAFGHDMFIRDIAWEITECIRVD